MMFSQPRSAYEYELTLFSSDSLTQPCLFTAGAQATFLKLSIKNLAEKIKVQQVVIAIPTLQQAAQPDFDQEFGEDDFFSNSDDIDFSIPTGLALAQDLKSDKRNKKLWNASIQNNQSDKQFMFSKINANDDNNDIIIAIASLSSQVGIIPMKLTISVNNGTAWNKTEQQQHDITIFPAGYYLEKQRIALSKDTSEASLTEEDDEKEDESAVADIKKEAIAAYYGEKVLLSWHAPQNVSIGYHIDYYIEYANFVYDSDATKNRAIIVGNAANLRKNLYEIEVAVPANLSQQDDKSNLYQLVVVLTHLQTKAVIAEQKLAFQQRVRVKKPHLEQINCFSRNLAVEHNKMSNQLEATFNEEFILTWQALGEFDEYRLTAAGQTQPLVLPGNQKSYRAKIIAATNYTIQGIVKLPSNKIFRQQASVNIRVKHPQHIAATLPFHTRGAAIAAIEISADTKTCYIADEHQVTILDSVSQQQITQFSLAKSINFANNILLVSPDQKKLYVAVIEKGKKADIVGVIQDTIQVYDIQDLHKIKLIKEISVAANPHDLTLNAEQGVFYVATEQDISIIDIATDQLVTTLAIDEKQGLLSPGALLFVPSLKQLFVANYRHNTISVIDSNRQVIVDSITLKDGFGLPTALNYLHKLGCLFVIAASHNKILKINLNNSQQQFEMPINDLQCSQIIYAEQLPENRYCLYFSGGYQHKFYVAEFTGAADRESNLISEHPTLIFEGFNPHLFKVTADHLRCFVACQKQVMFFWTQDFGDGLYARLQDQKQRPKKPTHKAKDSDSNDLANITDKEAYEAAAKEAEFRKRILAVDDNLRKQGLGIAALPKDMLDSETKDKQQPSSIDDLYASFGSGANATNSSTLSNKFFRVSDVTASGISVSTALFNSEKLSGRSTSSSSATALAALTDADVNDIFAAPNTTKSPQKATRKSGLFSGFGFSSGRKGKPDPENEDESKTFDKKM